MAKKLSEWGQTVRIEMIKRGWGVKELAEAANMSREYTSAVINGRVLSPPAIKKICDILNIEETAQSSLVE